VVGLEVLGLLIDSFLGGRGMGPFDAVLDGSYTDLKCAGLHLSVETDFLYEGD
jgi:hypothetical protein